MKKDIMPRNEYGEAHGYWERYYNNDKLMYKGYFNNGEKVGLCKYFDGYGIMYFEVYYII